LNRVKSFITLKKEFCNNKTQTDEILKDKATIATNDKIAKKKELYALLRYTVDYYSYGS
jgi:hypothetical protein